MDWPSLLAIAVALAMDAMAVSIAVGTRLVEITPRHVFRLAFHFGLFQAMMPVIGWTAGWSLAEVLARYDHWIAFCILAGVGLKMLDDAIRDNKARLAADPTRGWSLVGLSVATSLDALAVGFSIALIGLSVWKPAVVIGLVAAAASTLGITLGARWRVAWGRWAEAAGGVILIGIGVSIVMSHLNA
ncbi:MAG: manganese efflux pump [Pirellulales bacterium]|nr:manganese efflux pump [Pirellulales bacterium]